MMYYRNLMLISVVSIFTKENNFNKNISNNNKYS